VPLVTTGDPTGNNVPMARHTLVSFHAHPDDEALLCAGTLAKAAAAGHRVVLVVATSGEVGDADATILDGTETLGERRRRETMASAAALGIQRVEFLGYADSGLMGDHRPAGLTAFVDADPHEAASRLAALLTEESADVLTTYDANGGYGHPDHVRVHEVGALAADLAGTPVLLESTVNRDVLFAGVQLAKGMGFDIPPAFDPAELGTWFSPGEVVTHTIDVSDHLTAKRASMSAHASQATSDDDDDSTRTLARILDLPEDLYALAFGTEWFIERGRTPDNPAVDVFASLAAAGPLPVSGTGQRD
jgi:LmbE family N-acetylglucosaminyl deacetylase